MELQKVNITVKVDKNYYTSIDAIARARRVLKKERLVNTEIEGYIMIDGPDVSDLFVIKPATRGKSYSIKACSGDEWTNYFYTFISSRKQ